MRVWVALRLNALFTQDSRSRSAFLNAMKNAHVLANLVTKGIVMLRGVDGRVRAAAPLVESCRGDGTGETSDTACDSCSNAPPPRRDGQTTESPHSAIDFERDAVNYN